MGFFSGLFSKATTEPIEAVGNALDKLFTSDEERAAGKVVLEKLRQQPHVLQAEITKVEASHRSFFVAGARPFILWVCGVGLAFPFVINPVLQWYTGQPGPAMATDALVNLVLALVGLGGLRTAEKLAGKAK